MAAADRPVGPAAVAAALALHLALFAAFMLAVKPKTIPMGDAVPITIVTDAPPTAPAKAEIAPVAQTAQAENPAPEAPPPQPTPAAAPAQPKPIVAPKPKPAPIPKPMPEAKPAKAKTAPTPTLDLDALQASLAKSTHPAAPRPSFAERGPPRPQTAPFAAATPGISRADQAGAVPASQSIMESELQRGGWRRGPRLLDLRRRL